ncbi:unnamed protein product [Auanema sp. JU1783]|nr:unnamed protein product [Auanema sp. JU1783]
MAQHRLLSIFHLLFILSCLLLVASGSIIDDQDDQISNELEDVDKRARNPYSWMERSPEKRSRNPYSWMSSNGLEDKPKRARNPYSWLEATKAKRHLRFVDDIARQPRNPYSWQYTMFDKRTRNPYSWQNV